MRKLPVSIERLGKLRKLERAKAKSQVLLRTNKLKPYYRDPVAFVHDCFTWPDGEGPAFYQDAALADLIEYRRVCIRGPHGLGKSATESWLLLWFALTRDGVTDWKIPVTASAWRQLTHYLFPEFHKWARRLRWDVIGRAPFNKNSELLTLNLHLTTGEAFAVASSDPALIEGAHATSLLYLYDEAKAIVDGTFDAAEGAFSNAGNDSGAEAFAFAASTPGAPAGRFYDIQQRKPGTEDWRALHVSLDDTIKAGRISRDWAEQRKKQWGEKSAVYQNRVEGNFADSGEDSVIPLSWVEAANERWRACDNQGIGKRTFGVDPSGGKGGDNAVIARQVGSVLEDINYQAWDDPMATTGRVIAAMKYDPTIPVAVDVIGVGAGVVARLRELKYKVTAVNVAEATDLTDDSGELRFVNLRSALWWLYREALDPAGSVLLALPDDDVLTGDLTAPTFRFTSKGLIQVESKDELRKRLGRSTDAADGAMLAYYAALSREPEWDYTLT